MNRKIYKWMIACTIGASAMFAALPVHAAETVTIKPGDTLWKISQAKHVSLDRLYAANPGIDPLNLQIGQKINLPDKQSGRTYTVQGDETFWLISRKLGIPVDQLIAANPDVDPLNLYDGLEISLPAADTPQTAYTLSAASLSTGSGAETAGRRVLTVDGQMVPYKRVLTMKASAYSASPEENGPWGAVDYFGNDLKLGAIAVDPDVIPLGSRLYITGYDHHGLPDGGMYGTASDIGGSIDGNRVDIFIPGSRSEVASFGFQNVTVYILE